MQKKESTSNFPRVLVLIPAFNSGPSLTRAIQSLQEDGCAHDILVVDDGSAEPQAPYVPTSSPTQVIRLHENCGIAAALNAGLRYAAHQGYEFVARLDADDVSLPGRLQSQVERLDANDDVVVVGTWTQFVDERGRQRYVQRGKDDDKWLKRAMHFLSPFSHPSLMFRTRVAMEVGGYPNRYTNLAEDYDFLWRLAARGKFSMLERPLVRCTVTQSGLSISRRRAQLRARRNLQWEHIDATLPAWLGLITTVALQLVPVPLLTAAKGLTTSLRSHRGVASSASTSPSGGAVDSVE